MASALLSLRFVHRYGATRVNHRLLLATLAGSSDYVAADAVAGVLAALSGLRLLLGGGRTGSTLDTVVETLLKQLPA